MEKVLKEIRDCSLCAKDLPLGPNPVVQMSSKSRIVIIGQAPGTKVHKSGIPWDDQSGKRLRNWLGVNEAQFYDPAIFGIVPMGFCYPGKGPSGDLPPRKECAPAWHDLLFSFAKNVELTLLIGQYAQQYYLGNTRKKSLTETVKNYEEYLPKFMVLPHPSPRNGIWLRKNPWFDSEVIPELKGIVSTLID